MTENEIQLNRAGNEIVADELVYLINEPDNYAVEEALQIVAKVGGSVTVATVGGEDDEEVLRREMAMGANRSVLITDETFNGSDGRGIATILKSLRAEGTLRPNFDRSTGRGLAAAKPADSLAFYEILSPTLFPCVRRDWG
jgi:electron transfer flavoprotein alpha/beta subunit